MKQVYAYGAFDDIRSPQVRFLQEASKLGEVNVCLLSDEAITRLVGAPPKFPLQERAYFLKSIRYVTRLLSTDAQSGINAPPKEFITAPGVWVVSASDDNQVKKDYCHANGLEYAAISKDEVRGFPVNDDTNPAAGNNHPKALVTGCYDWLHTGHIRFFEEASSYGELHVVVGHDANLRSLKGDGHPLFPQEERRYMVQSIRFVHKAFISSGDGWLDAEPEIEMIQPDFYIVNEDGDRSEKREFCDNRGIKYVVLKRTPKEGLPKRESTQLRGF